MPGYLIARTTIRDPEAYRAYKEKATEAIGLYGGQPVVGPGEQSPLENGDAGERHVVIRFASVADVRRFYDSPEYAAARALRAAAADVEMFVAEGVE